jgi:hypothetical protein
MIALLDKGPGADRPHPGMRITLTSAAAVFAAALGAAHAASPGHGDVLQRGLKFVGGPVHEGGHGPRRVSRHDRPLRWRRLAGVRDDQHRPRATEADRCWMRIRSTWNGRASRPKWRSCDAALHRRFSHPARVNVTCVTPLGEEVASTS